MQKSLQIDCLDLGAITSTKFKIHPMIPLSILEAFYRRKESDFVVGTLLGVFRQGRIELTNCYPVPCKSDNGVQSHYDIKFYQVIRHFSEDYHQTRYALNQKVYEQEKVIGWFTTQTELCRNHAELQHYYSQSKKSKFTTLGGNLTSPIFLTLDPTIQNGSFDMRGYINEPLKFCNKTLALFKRVDLLMEFSSENKNEIKSLLWDNSNPQSQITQKIGYVNLNQLDSFDKMLIETTENIKQIEVHLQEAKNKKVAVDPKVNKLLQRVLAIWPSISDVGFEKLMVQHKQDSSMLKFLSGMVKTQIILSEKLNKIFKANQAQTRT